MTKEKLPNLITALRIAGTAGLIFAQPLTPLYFVIYTLCGLSDVLDGWLARHTGSASDFGARLDSLADLFFYTVMIVGLAMGATVSNGQAVGAGDKHRAAECARAPSPRSGG